MATKQMEKFDSQIEKLQSQLDIVKQRKKAAEAREKEKERKARTKRLIVLGADIEKIFTEELGYVPEGEDIRVCIREAARSMKNEKSDEDFYY